MIAAVRTSTEGRPGPEYPCAVAEMRLGLAYDDVLIVPRRSSVRSRRDVSTRSRFTRRLELAVPIVSANMDTVTESALAIALAQSGGIGVVHRFLPIEREAAEVARVKRFLNYVIEDPYRITPERTVAEARAETAQRGVTGLLVADGEGLLLGILTARDLRAEPDERPVREAMTPLDRLVTAPPDVGLEEARELMHRHRVEKLPLAREGRLAGLITMRDVELRERFPDATRDERGRLCVAAAVGVRDDALPRAQALVDAGVDAIVLDIAHGHSEHALDALRELKAAWPGVDVVAGNVATAAGVADLVEAGADAVKVGIGPGFVCTTRLVAGAGVPQLTCVLDCARAGAELAVPIVADGGVRRPADVAKAIAAGADSVMVGSLFAGTRESPGEIVERGGRRYKVYRGMASRAAAAARSSQEGREEALDQYVPEGVESVVPLKESVTEILAQLAGGLRSGMSYAGARTVAEFREAAELIRITPAGRLESEPGTGDA
jgi:IMP dehydrogenase